MRKVKDATVSKKDLEAPPPGKPSGEKIVLQGVTYGSSLGLKDSEVSMGVKVDPSKITPQQCRKFLCGTEVEATINADPNAEKDIGDQGKMLDDVEEILVNAKIKGFSTNPKGIGFRLVMADTVVLDDLKKIRHRSGKLVLELLE